MSTLLDIEVRGRAAYLTLNRPEARNALNRELVDALVDALDHVARTDSIRCAVLTGAGGRAFSAGADLKEYAALQATDPSSARAADPISPLAGRTTKPLIAAIDGHAVAAGLELALICDIRIATRQSRFGLPEPRRGLMAGYGLHHLSRMIPLGEALHMQLTGLPIDAARAFQIGLIQHVAVDRRGLMEHAEKLVDAIDECAPLAVSAIKQVVSDGRHLTPPASHALAASLQESVYRSSDFLEGPRAYAEGRRPSWQGR